MTPKGSITFLCGPRLGLLARELGDLLHARTGSLTAADPKAYAKGLLAAFFRVGAGQGDLLLWLPDGGPVLSVHERRALERVVQGLRPAVLVEIASAGAYPPFLKAVGGALPVYPLLESAAPSGPGGPGKAPSASSKEGTRTALEQALGRIRPVNPGAGTGSWRQGGVLMVGDRPNARSWGKFEDAVSWPFVSLLGTGCSAWLSEQLELTGIPETMLYWVNAFRGDGTPTGDLRELADRLKPQRTVALGRHAAQVLEAAAVPFEEVHHPQHWKRFHHGKRYPLVKLLAKVKLQ